MSEFTTTIESRLHQLFNERAAKRSAGALAELQRQAFEQFAAKGLPAPKSESYKFTPIARILEKNLGESTPTPTSWKPEDLKKHFYPITEANHLVFVNGTFRPDLSLIKSDSKDLIIKTIDATSFSQEASLKELGQVEIGKADVFNALNLSLFENGLLLQTSRKSSNLPVFVYQFIDGAESFVFSRVFIHCEASSELQVYEKVIFDSSNTFFSSILEAEIKENAIAHVTKLQHYSKKLFSVEGIYAHQLRDSRFHSHTFSFQAGLIRNNVGISIDGENCEGYMNGLYHLSGDTHVDNNTAVDHRKPNSYSNELYKGILDEKSRAVFNGRIYVRPDAQKTNAFQSNNNILLSSDAVINTKPQLEIWADDVKCSHGCTTGQLDEEAIFYLRSRGIQKVQAKALLLNAFANQTLEKVPSELVRAEVEGLILSKLGQ